MPGSENAGASRVVGLIEPGDPVLLRHQAFSYQKFGHQEGRSAVISRSALRSGEFSALIGNARRGELFYRVRVPLVHQSTAA